MRTSRVMHVSGNGWKQNGAIATLAATDSLSHTNFLIASPSIRRQGLRSAYWGIIVLYRATSRVKLYQWYECNSGKCLEKGALNIGDVPRMPMPLVSGYIIYLCVGYKCLHWNARKDSLFLTPEKCSSWATWSVDLDNEATLYLGDCEIHITYNRRPEFYKTQLASESSLWMLLWFADATKTYDTRI